MDSCQYLLSSQINYTLTHLAEHLQTFSHDAINRYLRGEQLTPRLLWEQAREVMEQDEAGYLLFEDTLLDKSYGPCIEMTRRQWSGNAPNVVRGLGLVSCVYGNSITGQFWVIDYRLFDPDHDGKTKLDHVQEMLQAARQRQVLFATGLMDSWYTSKDVMLAIDGYKPQQAKKFFYCPLKCERLVADSGGTQPYQRVEHLHWSDTELAQGKLIKLKGFASDYKVRLLRVVVSPHRTDWIVTNDLTQDSTQRAQEACAVRWKIEAYHREVKQLTGIEQCQCRKARIQPNHKARIQPNHIACALLVWLRLKKLAYQTGRTVYAIKRGLLHDYLVPQLKRPTVPMVFA